MPRSFTDSEKEEIRLKLIQACKKSWSQHGYKKTSIADLCAAVGIATGSFYNFYENKEALFCDMMDDFQEGTRLLYEEMLSTPPKKSEIVDVLKIIYLEYAENDIITKRHTNDYKTLMSRLPEVWRQEHKERSVKNLSESLFAPGLKMKMEKEKAHRVIDTLLLTVVNKVFFDDHFEIFCLLLEKAIDEIYE